MKIEYGHRENTTISFRTDNVRKYEKRRMEIEKPRSEKRAAWKRHQKKRLYRSTNHRSLAVKCTRCRTPGFRTKQSRHLSAEPADRLGTGTDRKSSPTRSLLWRTQAQRGSVDSQMQGRSPVSCRKTYRAHRALQHSTFVPRSFDKFCWNFHWNV